MDGLVLRYIDIFTFYILNFTFCIVLTHSSCRQQPCSCVTRVKMDFTPSEQGAGGSDAGIGEYLRQIFLFNLDGFIY